MIYQRSIVAHLFKWILLAAAVLFLASCGSTDEAQTTQGVDAEASEVVEESVDDALPAVDEQQEGESQDTSEEPEPTSDSDPDAPWPEPPPIWQDFRRTRLAELAHYEGEIQAELGAPLPQRLEPGRHMTSSLDMHLEFVIERPHVLVEENPGHILMVDRPGGDSIVYFLRPVGAFMGEAVLDANALVAGRGLASPLPEDLAVWRMALPDVTASEPEPTTVAGFDATRFDLSLSEDLGYFCTPGTCVNLFPSGAAIQGIVGLQGGQTARIWEVELDGTDLVVVAKTPSEGDLAWFDEVDAIVDSLVIDDVRPSSTDSAIWDPRGYAPPGTNRWAGIDWVTTSFEDELQFFNVDGNLIFHEVDVDVWFKIARVEASLKGEPIDSADDFADLLTTDLALTSVEPVDPIALPGEQIEVLGSWRTFDEDTGPMGVTGFSSPHFRTVKHGRGEHSLPLDTPRFMRLNEAAICG